MRKRRLLAGLLAAVMSVGMLTGCGGSGGSSSGDSNQAQSKDGDVTIRVALWDYSNTEYYKTMFDAFSAKYPDIKVEVVEFAADEYSNTLITQLGGKQDFDAIFIKDVPSVAALVKQGHLMALDDLMAADENFKSENYLGLVEQLTQDGKTYGIPFRKDNNLLFYNKDLFDAANVAYPEDGMTMAEYHELAAKLTSGQGNDKVYGAHFHTWPSNAYLFSRRTEAFNQLEPDTFDVLKDYYTEILAMQDEGVIQDYGALKASNIHYSGVFYNQQAAMMQMGTWYINMLLENVKDFNWGVCSIPDNDGMGNVNAVGGVTPISIGAYAKHPQEAWTFINYVCGEEGAEVIAKTGILPGYNSDKINQIFDDIPKTYPNAPEGMSKYLDVEKYVIEFPMDPHAKEIDNIFQEQHSAIMTKSVTVEEGVEQLKTRVEETMAQ